MSPSRSFKQSVVMIAMLTSAFSVVTPSAPQAQANVPPVTITEYPLPTPDSFPGGLAVGGDKAIWFYESGANKIGRITVDGHITEYPIPTANSALPRQGFVGSGPDGAIWFTESAANKLGRISPDGKISEYPIPSAAALKDPASGKTVNTSFPIAVVTGPDGAVWFNERNTNKIGRITLDGRITETPTLSQGTGYLGLSVGADHALWGTDNFSPTNKIARIALDGKVTEYLVPTPRAGVLRITAGPDGALWFCEFGANKIGRVTVDGKFSEYDLPTGMGPVGITAGPDQALWFTGYNSNEIGRLTTAGALTRYAVPTEKSQPYHLVSGPDGNLWFTEIQGDKIGRVNLAELKPATLPQSGTPLSSENIRLMALIAAAILAAGLILIRRASHQE
jgi:virginiamycin B lyase